MLVWPSQRQALRIQALESEPRRSVLTLESFKLMLDHSTWQWYSLLQGLQAKYAHRTRLYTAFETRS